MPKRVFRGAQIVINSTDLSEYVSQVTLTYNQDNPEATAIGDSTRDRVTGGLKDWSFQVTFFQDYTSGSVDDILFNLIGSATKVDIEVVPRATDPISKSNPRYHGKSVFGGYNPVEGSPGAVETTGQATFSAAGTLFKDVA